MEKPRIYRGKQDAKRVRVSVWISKELLEIIDRKRRIPRGQIFEVAIIRERMNEIPPCLREELLR